MPSQFKKKTTNQLLIVMKKDIYIIISYIKNLFPREIKYIKDYSLLLLSISLSAIGHLVSLQSPCLLSDFQHVHIQINLN